MMMNRTGLPWASLGVVLCMGALAFAAVGEEENCWPQFRYDAGRTAASPASVPDDLQLRWTWTLPEPKPAYPNEIKSANVE